MYPYHRSHYYPPPQSYHFYSPEHAHRPYWNRQQFPNVNPALFMSSAKHMQAIMRDASILLERMSSSQEFSYAIMEAAQKSDQQQVDTLIKNTGIEASPKISYTPDGLKLNFEVIAENLNCCQLTLSLRWRR